MPRLLAFVSIVLASSIAFAEDDIPFDPSIDECAAPDSGCLPAAPEPTDESLELEEMTQVEATGPIVWSTAVDQLACAEGSTAQSGHCIADASVTTETGGGCTAGHIPGLVVGGMLIALLVYARRRRVLLLLAACSLDAGSWDDAVDAGPTGDAASYVDVFSAELATGAQFLLANQPVVTGGEQPVAQFSLLRARDGVPLFRATGACGDRLASTGDELLGWGRADAGDGTAALVELAAPDGCAFTYETDAETIDNLVTQGYRVLGTVAHVWPPGIGDAPAVEPSEPEPTTLAAPAPCNVNKRSALQLLYASPGKDYTLRFLRGCPGEVVIGEKREAGPVGMMKSAEAQAAGGRTAFVLDRHGDKLRELLLRNNGVERTAAYLRNKMQAGYDYIVIDEVTAAADFRDGATLNRRLRKLLLRMPTRTIIPYISIDLTQYPSGFADMRSRRLLLRAFKLRARVMGLEVYLHTPQVRAGQAPSAFRRAADRLALAVSGLPRAGGINGRAITVIGTSIHGGTTNLPQYSYLDQPSYDLRSLSRQVNAIRHGSKRLRQQSGVGWYFVFKGDMDPRPGGYTYEALIRRMRLLGLRFR